MGTDGATVRYVAFLRGIGPGGPNMANEELRGVVESLGCTDVRSVISSANLIFDAAGSEPAELEDDIQAALQAQLGTEGGTLVRTAEEVQAAVAARPFGERVHTSVSYLTMTMLQDRTVDPRDDDLVPYWDLDDRFEVVAFDLHLRALCASSDDSGPAPELIRWLERHFGTGTTTRTWRTVERIAARL